MDTILQLLLLVIAIGIGWALGFTSRKQKPESAEAKLPSNLKDRLKILFETYSEESMDSFVQSLEVNSETVGMHLSIGAHFRKSGEVDKAILVHQNLMSRPEIPPSFSDGVVFELAKDYMAAGLLDRAETLLLQLKRSKRYGEKSLTLLVDVYQQEREWANALSIGRSLQSLAERDINVTLAHFCCELAEEALSVEDYLEARRRIKEALKYDRKCVRATLLSADIYFDSRQYSDAVAVLRQVEGQDERFIVEAIPRLLECSFHLKTEAKYREYLAGLLERRASTSVMLGIAESLYRELGVEKAVEFLMDSLVDTSSLRGLDKLIDYQLAEADEVSDTRLIRVVKQVTSSLLVARPVYRCSGCGFSGGQLHWQCPSCKQWGQIAPILGVEGE